MRVLIVEDEPISQRALRFLLQMHGYDADVAGSAEQAIKVLAADGHQFDVVLVDVDLPGKDGMELLRDVRKLDPDAKPVLLTAVKRERVRPATRAGVPYLRKPIDFNRLLGILGESSGQSALHH